MSEACSKCDGRGKYAYALGASKENWLEVDCPECGGSGRSSDQLANTLSGDAESNMVRVLDQLEARRKNGWKV